MDLSLVGTDVLLDEIQRRSQTGLIFMAKAEGHGMTHRFKRRTWGSPLLIAGCLRAMNVENDSFFVEIEDIPTGDW